MRYRMLPLLALVLTLGMLSLSVGSSNLEARSSKLEARNSRLEAGSLEFEYPASSFQPLVSGPRGGSVAAVAISPAFPSDRIVFAGVREYGVYRSTDAGWRWERVTPDEERSGWVIGDLELSPAFPDDQTLFVLTDIWTYGGNVYRSTDGGNSWQSPQSHPDGMPPGLRQLVISPDFANDQSLYVLHAFQSLVSTDGGRNFSDMPDWFGGKNVMALAFSPDYASDHTLFAATSETLYRSTDAGGSWTAIGTGLPGYPLVLAVSPNFGLDGTLLAVSSQDRTVYRSTDSGDSWVAGDLTVERGVSAWLAFSPNFAADNVVFAGGGGPTGVYRSTDGGLHWEAVGSLNEEGFGLPGPNSFDMAFSPAYGSDYFSLLATSAGIYRTASPDNPPPWRPANDGLPRLPVTHIAAAPAWTNTLFAATSFFETVRAYGTGHYDANIHRSTDGGKTWHAVSPRLDPVQALVVSPNFSGDHTVFAATGYLAGHGAEGGTVYRSTDGGLHWETVGDLRYVHHLVISPDYSHDQTLFANAMFSVGSPTGPGIFRSTDGGETWTRLSVMFPAWLAISPDFEHDDILLAATPASLYRSADRGATWSLVLSGSFWGPPLLSPHFWLDRTAYVVNGDQLYRSRDAGLTWQPVTDDLPDGPGVVRFGPADSLTTVVEGAEGAHQTSQSHQTLQTSLSTVLRSTDGGGHWLPLDGPLSMRVDDLLWYRLVPGNVWTLFAAGDDGLWSLRWAEAGPWFGDWRSGGPRGGEALAIALSPEYADDGLVFAGGGHWLSGRGDRFGKGLFRSTDGGQTWVPGGEGITGGYSSSIEDVDLSNHWLSDGTAFVGTWGGLFRTTDWGASWQRVAEEVLYLPGAVSVVAISPGYYLDGIVLAGGGYGNIYYTEDGGEHWQLSLEIGPVEDIAFSPLFLEDTTAFTCAWGGVWRTQDRAAHWSQVLNLESRSATDVEVSCAFETDHTVYATTPGGEPPYLMRSTDGGDSWHPADNGLDRVVNVMAIACDGDSGTLFAGGTALFRSTDGGDSWTSLPGWPEGVSIEELAVSPQYASDQTLLAGTYSGVYRSTDGGVSWTLSEGFVPLETQVVAPSPAYADDGTLFAGTEMGVYKSTDRGYSWQPANKGLVGSFASHIRDIVVSPSFADDRTLFASWKLSGRMGGNVYRSTDAGENWEQLWGTEYVGDLAISPQFPADQTLFATGPGGMVFKSTDGGEHFEPKIDGFEQGFQALEIGISPEYGSDQTVYVAGFGSVHRSTDGGEHWEPLPSGSPTYGIALSPSFGDDGTLFASYREIEPSGEHPESGVIRSTDGGASWELATAGLPGTYEPFPQSLALSPDFAADGMLYTALSGAPFLGPNQVYASASAGDSWAPLPPIPEEPSLFKLSVSSEQGGYDTLHAGTGAGAWHYSSACFNVIANGGFEFDTGWILPTTEYPAAYSLDLAHSGSRSMRTGIPPGGPNVQSYSSAYQNVTIPAGVASATLRFWEYPLSGEARRLRLQAGVNPLAMAPAGDAQYVLVLDAEGGWLQTLLWQASDDRLWTYHEFDLSAYAGQTIRLHFGTYNDGTGGLTAMYVDDVSLEICPELPPTPTPTSTPTRERAPFYLPLLTKRYAPPTPTPSTGEPTARPNTPTSTPSPTHTPTLTPTPTSSPTYTSTPTPGCTEAVVNGGFEADAAWNIPDTSIRADYSTTVAHSGSRSMRTGIPEGGSNVLSYSAAYQTITLPPGPGTAILSFWYYPVSGEVAASSALLPDAGYSILEARYSKLELPASSFQHPASSLAADRQYALLRDGSGIWHLLLWTLSDARTWLHYEADISAYLGQTVRLHFETCNDGLGGTTAMYVDDVSIEVCPGAVATPTPTPTLTPTDTPTYTPTPTSTATPVLPYVLATIALPPGSHPHGVALDLSGNRVFVGHHGPAHDGHAISVIDSSSLTVTATIDLGAEARGPNGVGYHPGTDRVYVANRNSDNVSVVDPTLGDVVGHLAVGSLPNGVAVVDDLVYVANFDDDTVSVIDANTATMSHTIPLVGAEPSHFAVDAAQGFAYLSLHGDGAVSYLHNGARWNYLPGVPEAYGIAFDPFTRLLYVGNRGEYQTVTVVDVDTNNVLDTFAVSREPYMLGVNPNTGHLFVVAGDELQVRRTADASLVVTLPLPAGAEEGITVDVVHNRVYITSRDADAVTVVQDVP